MSRRNTDPTERQMRKLRKLTRRKLPRYFDIVDWLKMRRYAQTTGEAERLILAGRLRSGSHTVGIVEVDVKQPDGKTEKQKVVQRVQPVVFRDELIVIGT